MRSPTFRALADALTATADALEAAPKLDPDSAVRLVVWGTPHAHMPVLDTADSYLYEETVSAIECRHADRHGEFDPWSLCDIPRDEALLAAREEAARFASYVEPEQ